MDNPKLLLRQLEVSLALLNSSPLAKLLDSDRPLELTASLNSSSSLALAE